VAVGKKGYKLRKNTNKIDSCIRIEVEFNLQPTVSRPFCLGVSHLEPMTRFQFSVWQLRDFFCRALSLTRGWACNLLVQLLLGLARAITLGSKSRRTQTIFYCIIWDSPNLEGKVPVFISPRNRVAQLYPRALGFLSVAFYDSQELRWRYSDQLSQGSTCPDWFIEVNWFNTVILKPLHVSILYQ
jgi:hypothetical protein